MIETSKDFLSQNKAQIIIAVCLGLVSLAALKRYLNKKAALKYPNEIDFDDKRVQEKLGRNLNEFLSNIGKNHDQFLLDLQKLYPNECSLRLPNSQQVVFLNSFASFKKFNQKVSSLEPIANRPKNLVFKVVSKNYLGSFFRLYDDRLKEIRKSTLNGLHKLTANAVEFEAKLTDEIEFFIDFINSKCLNSNGQLSSAPVHLQQISTNMIVTVGIDARFPYEVDLNTAVKNQINNITEILTAVDMVSISNLVDPNALKPLEPKLNSIYEFLTGALNGYKSNYEKDVIRTFGDYVLSKQDELKKIKKLNPEDNYSDEDILVQFFTLLMAGASTTGLTLSWAFYYLGKHPEVQSKIYEEMARTVGTGSLIGYSKHHMHLKYTEAVVNEILRLASTQPLIPRATVPTESGQVNVDAYTLPSDTPVLINAFAMHRDAAYWQKDAERFDPSRWLNERDELISYHDSFIPFGVGPRSCLGDTLSRMILFLVVANLVQRFQITFVPENAKSAPTSSSKIGVMRRPHNYHLKFEARK